MISQRLTNLIHEISGDKAVRVLIALSAITMFVLSAGAPASTGHRHDIRPNLAISAILTWKVSQRYTKPIQSRFVTGCLRNRVKM